MNSTFSREETFKLIEDIPESFRELFASYPCFNRVQSAVFEDILNSDNSLVVTAPTGSGKTVLFELAIVKLLMESEDPKFVKAVYVAPVKALCTERFLDWSSRFAPLGVSCIEVTGDSVDTYNFIDHQVILTTPEKWDALTRKWRDNLSIVQLVKLIMIDEIHLLNDSKRGPTLETIVSRMKTVISYLKNESRLRFFAVSATIFNIEDLAQWLGDGVNPAKHYRFGSETRPVALNKVVKGYPQPKGQRLFLFDIHLSYKIKNLIQDYGEGKPVLIFCSTRRGVEQTCKILAEQLFFNFDPDLKLLLETSARDLNDKKLKEYVVKGCAYHHAGMSAHDRNLIQEIFTQGALPVLVATSTLAMGVNLPAHLVIIKSTYQYNSGKIEEYSSSAILQMVGRAGRPQFDTSATAIIMTRQENVGKYEALLDCKEVIESSLHLHLAEQLNSEIVLYTIVDLGVAMDWLRSTFLYQRAFKNPQHYGIAPGSDSKIEKDLELMVMRELNALKRAELVEFNENGLDISPTPNGRLMSHYYINLRTFQLFSQITPHSNLKDLLDLLAEIDELNDVQLRVTEKKFLNDLNASKMKETIRFGIKGKIKTRQMKINCLTQACLGCLQLSESSLQQELIRIVTCQERVARCLSEYLSRKNLYCPLRSCVTLAKCLHARLWENSVYVARQLEKIGPALCSSLVACGKVSFDLILQSHPMELEQIMNRGPPLGSNIINQARHLPLYSLSVRVDRDSILRCAVIVSVSILNLELIQEYSTAGRHHCVSIIVGDTSNRLIHYRKIFDSALLQGEVTFCANINAPLPQKVFVHLISEQWVGLDVSRDFIINPMAETSLNMQCILPGAVIKPTKKDSLSKKVDRPVTEVKKCTQSPKTPKQTPKKQEKKTNSIKNYLKPIEKPLVPKVPDTNEMVCCFDLEPSSEPDDIQEIAECLSNYVDPVQEVPKSTNIEEITVEVSEDLALDSNIAHLTPLERPFRLGVEPTSASFTEREKQLGAVKTTCTPGSSFPQYQNPNAVFPPHHADSEGKEYFPEVRIPAKTPTKSNNVSQSRDPGLGAAKPKAPCPVTASSLSPQIRSTADAVLRYTPSSEFRKPIIVSSHLDAAPQFGNYQCSEVAATASCNETEIEESGAKFTSDPTSKCSNPVIATLESRTESERAADSKSCRFQNPLVTNAASIGRHEDKRTPVNKFSKKFQSPLIAASHFNMGATLSAVPPVSSPYPSSVPNAIPGCKSVTSSSHVQNLEIAASHFRGETKSSSASTTPSFQSPFVAPLRFTASAKPSPFSKPRFQSPLIAAPQERDVTTEPAFIPTKSQLCSPVPTTPFQGNDTHPSQRTDEASIENNTKAHSNHRTDEVSTVFRPIASAPSLGTGTEDSLGLGNLNHRAEAESVVFSKHSQFQNQKSVDHHHRADALLGMATHPKISTSNLIAEAEKSLGLENINPNAATAAFSMHSQFQNSKIAGLHHRADTDPSAVLLPTFSTPNLRSETERTPRLNNCNQSAVRFHSTDIHTGAVSQSPQNAQNAAPRLRTDAAEKSAKVGAEPETVSRFSQFQKPLSINSYTRAETTQSTFSKSFQSSEAVAKDEGGSSWQITEIINPKSSSAPQYSTGSLYGLMVNGLAEPKFDEFRDSEYHFPVRYDSYSPQKTPLSPLIERSQEMDSNFSIPPNAQWSASVDETRENYKNGAGSEEAQNESDSPFEIPGHLLPSQHNSEDPLCEMEMGSPEHFAADQTFFTYDGAEKDPSPLPLETTLSVDIEDSSEMMIQPVEDFARTRSKRDEVVRNEVASILGEVFENDSFLKVAKEEPDYSIEKWNQLEQSLYSTQTVEKSTNKRCYPVSKQNNSSQTPRKYSKIEEIGNIPKSFASYGVRIPERDPDDPEEIISLQGSGAAPRSTISRENSCYVPSQMLEAQEYKMDLPDTQTQPRQRMNFSQFSFSKTLGNCTSTPMVSSHPRSSREVLGSLGNSRETVRNPATLETPNFDLVDTNFWSQSQKVSPKKTVQLESRCYPKPSFLGQKLRSNLAGVSSQRAVQEDWTNRMCYTQPVRVRNDAKENRPPVVKTLKDYLPVVKKLMADAKYSK